MVYSPELIYNEKNLKVYIFTVSNFAVCTYMPYTDQAIDFAISHFWFLLKDVFI